MEAAIPLRFKLVRIGSAGILLAVDLQIGSAVSQGVGATLSPGKTFSEQDGASIYANLCQGCHMRDGRGAVGAGAYPALGGDAAMDTPGFVIDVVLNGLREMPAFGRTMTDAQVAAVVTYVRARFGAGVRDAVTPSDVSTARR